jgi:hypothetical protein
VALTRIVSEIIQDNTIENRDISGSFTAGISGSWRGELSSSNMTDVGGGVSGSVTSTGSFGRVEAAGVVFADSFESVTGGATIDFNDNVNLTGNLTATGNISSSFTSTGSFGRVQTTNIDIDSISGNWTNAGNTVADLGTVTTVDINGGTVDGITSLTAGGNLDIGAHGFRSSTLTADSQTSGRVAIYSTAGLLSEDSDLTFSGATLSATNVTTTGTIKDFASVSGSYVSTGSVGRIQTRAAAIGTITGTTLSVTGNISSSATSTGSVGRLETQQTNASLGGSIINLAGNLTTQNNNVTINAAGAARTLTLNESLTIGDGHDGTITFGAASKTLTVENTSVVNQDLTSDASPTFAGGTVTGNLSVGGIFTAQEVHTEFESASVLFTSGSTRFGNDTTDVHRVTGSMDISGSLKIPHGNVTVTDTLTSTNIGAFNLTGKLTAGSTEIEGSAFDINGGTIDGITSLTAGGDLDIGSHDFRAATLTADGLTAGRVPFAGTNGVLSDDSDLTFATATLSATNLTTTGTIKNMTLVSGSSVSTGSFGNVNVLLDLDVDGVTNLDVVDIDGAVNMASTLEVEDVLTVAKNVSAGSAAKDTPFLTLSATDAGVNMSGGEGASILFKIPDDETNPSIGASIAGIKENADDSLSQTALSFNVSQNDETLDEAMRIASSGFVGIQTADTSGDLNLAGSFGAPLHVLQKPASQAYAAVFQGNSNTNGARIGIAEADSNLSTRANTLEIGFDSSTDFIFSRTMKDMIIGVSGSEQMRIKADGKIGVNTSNPVRPLSVSYGAAKTSTDTAYAMAIQSNESANQAALQFYVVGGASAAVRRFQIQSGEVGVANSGIIEFQPDGGDVRFPNGILFGSDTAAANELDDYEEGTWTVTVTGDSGNFVLSGTEETGAYTKIGDLVHAQGGIQINSENSCSGNIKFSLPFTSGNFTDLSERSFGTVWLVNTGETNSGHMVAVVTSAQAFFNIGQVADDGTNTYLTNAHVDGAWFLGFQITYKV